MTDQEPQIPFQSAVRPEALDDGTEIRFRCYKGISCFNVCCKNADVTLAPYDIVRLTRRLGMTSTDFLSKHTVPFQMDADGTPGVKLKTTDEGACLLLGDGEGCSVYSDRPTVCRNYPVALLALREKGSPEAKQHYSLVRESHCRGHDEERRISIAEYRAEQRCERYDDLNREWYQLILKKNSAGPTVGRPPLQSLQLFFMASYDLDTFRRFVLSDKFRATYVLPEALYAEVKESDEALLKFAFRSLRQVLFGDRSIQEGPNAWERRVNERKEVWDARRRMEIGRRQEAEDEKYGGYVDTYYGDK